MEYRRVLIQSGQGDRVAALDSHIGHRATTESVRALLANAGFEVADIVQSSFRLRFANGSALLRHYFIRLGFLQAWIGVANADKAEETFAVLERELNVVAAQRGELALTVPMAGFYAPNPERFSP